MVEEHYPNGALIYIGSFEVETGELHISDPCYKEMKSGVSVKVKNGLWHAFTRHNKRDSWFTKGDERVKEILAFHDHGQSRDENDFYIEPDWKKIGHVDVDSGQMSIFDKKYYRADSEAEGRQTDRYEKSRKHLPKEESEEEIESGELFYDAIGCITLPPPLWSCSMTMGGTLPHGACCISGEGDGGYDVYAAPKKFKGFRSDDKWLETPEIMCVRVDFFGSDEDDEDEEDEE